MSKAPHPEPRLVGLFTDEPIRMAGLTCVFEKDQGEAPAQLFPVEGTLQELLTRSSLEFLVVDLNSSLQGPEILETVHRARPDLRLIVIGPEGEDELVIQSIIAGARAYLDASAGPELVRKAIETVATGSIWAPRPLLSKLIDRLLVSSDSNLSGANVRLTDRENQVMELILMARSNREIALEMGIEERTVKSYVAQLKRKTGADSRIELSLFAMRNSLTLPPELVERRHETRRESDCLQRHCERIGDL
jgi:DNA-binding NarL/FixJ family response regulator